MNTVWKGEISTQIKRNATSNKRRRAETEETYNADIVSVEQNRVEFGRLLAFWGDFAARARFENLETNNEENQF